MLNSYNIELTLPLDVNIVSFLSVPTMKSVAYEYIHAFLLIS